MFGGLKHLILFTTINKNFWHGWYRTIIKCNKCISTGHRHLLSQICYTLWYWLFMLCIDVHQEWLKTRMLRCWCVVLLRSLRTMMSWYYFQIEGEENTEHRDAVDSDLHKWTINIWLCIKYNMENSSLRWSSVKRLASLHIFFSLVERLYSLRTVERKREPSHSFHSWPQKCWSHLGECV